MFTDETIVNPVELRARLAVAEATGRAAVRALERLQPLVESRAAHLWHSGKTQTSLVWQREAQAISAVLATDTARCWLAASESEATDARSR